MEISLENLYVDIGAYRVNLSRTLTWGWIGRTMGLMSGGGPWSPPGFDLATPAWGCKGGGCRWPCGPEGFNSGGGWPGMPNRKRNIVVSCGVTGLLWSLHFDRCKLSFAEIYVVVQFCPWFKFYFLLFLGMVMYDNEFETMKNKI